MQAVVHAISKLSGVAVAIVLLVGSSHAGRCWYARPGPFCLGPTASARAAPAGAASPSTPGRPPQDITPAKPRALTRMLFRVCRQSLHFASLGRADSWTVLVFSTRESRPTRGVEIARLRCRLTTPCYTIPGRNERQCVGGHRGGSTPRGHTRATQIVHACASLFDRACSPVDCFLQIVSQFFGPRSGHPQHVSRAGRRTPADVVCTIARNPQKIDSNAKPGNRSLLSRKSTIATRKTRRSHAFLVKDCLSRYFLARSGSHKPEQKRGTVNCFRCSVAFRIFCALGRQIERQFRVIVIRGSFIASVEMLQQRHRTRQVLAAVPRSSFSPPTASRLPGRQQIAYRPGAVWRRTAATAPLGVSRGPRTAPVAPRGASAVSCSTNNLVAAGAQLICEVAASLGSPRRRPPI